MLEVIDNHSIRKDLLTKRPVLDAGARGFRFSDWFVERGHEVYACDPSPDLVAPKSIKFDRVALVAKSWTDVSLCVSLHAPFQSDPEAWFVYRGPARWVSDYAVPAWNLAQHWPFTAANPADVIKLNIEGAEYDILREWPGPIARQISVSFHEHTDRARGPKACDDIIMRLREWYVVVRHVWEERYCAGFNYWDTLLILKELGG